jgi:hypothetical protein
MDSQQGTQQQATHSTAAHRDARQYQAGVKHPRTRFRALGTSLQTVDSFLSSQLQQQPQ